MNRQNKFLILLCLLSFCLESSQHKLYCMYTPDFEVLYEQYFLPSLKDDLEVIVYKYPQDCPSGVFRSEGWEKTMFNKLELLESAIIENWNNQVFFYSDIDIVFLRPMVEICLHHLESNDFVVQQGWPRNGICSGFLVMRGNEQTLQFIRMTKKLLQEKICVDDQVAMQTVLNGLQPGVIAWKLLPSEQFPNGRKVLKHTHGYYSEHSEIQLSDSMVLFHANCCIGLENKYQFIQRVQEKFLKND